MTGNIRQGIGLAVVAVLAALLSLPAWGSTSTAGGIWVMLTGAVAVVCGIVGLTKIAADLLRPQRD